MKKSTLTRTTLAGLTGLASLVSIARADMLENINIPESFSYDGGTCATLYESDREVEFCWDEPTKKQSTPMIVYELPNGCVWEYYRQSEEKTRCPYKLEDIELPEHL